MRVEREDMMLGIFSISDGWRNIIPTFLFRKLFEKCLCEYLMHVFEFSAIDASNY